MILTLNNIDTSDPFHRTHAYYYLFRSVMVYLEFSGDFKDVHSSLLDAGELSGLSSCQRRIIDLDLATCEEQWEAGERLLEYDDIFPVKSIDN